MAATPPAAPAAGVSKGPGHAVPAPLIPVVLLAVGVLLQRFVPVAHVPRVVALPAGVILIAAGVALWMTAGGIFHRVGTSPNPRRPATVLVTDGPFAFTRNPMYVGVVAIYLGLALLLDSVWALILVLALVPLLDVAAIRPEERFLEAHFGAPYAEYKKKVRRWL